MTALSSEGDSSLPRVSRRSAMSRVAAAGVTAAAAPLVADEEAEKEKTPDTISASDVAESEWLAGLELTEDQRESAARSVARLQRNLAAIRKVDVDYDARPAFRFDPELVDPDVKTRSRMQPEWLSHARTGIDDEPVGDRLEFRSIRELGAMLRAGRMTSVELTEHCLQRLKKYDELLNCVVNLTEDLALRQAEAADRELADGKDRGPLHGIPWGAKDLIAVEGYPTTWGAPQFRDQILPRTAPVAKRLEAAGAVLVAKLSLGALAMGDRWFGGQTRNPWNPGRGSSGSSAGPAAAVAAGLVPFAIGSETLGSIVSPSRRCGITGLRPTFGRVSRKDCMALSWSMDKIGPMARTIDDCGIVFDAIEGEDFGDPTTVDRWFEWPMQVDPSSLRIGKVEGVSVSREDEITLNVLEELGANITSVKLPHDLPVWALGLMLDVESGTIFHDLVANQNDAGLNSWPGTFRTAHFVSAVDYVRAGRVRTELMKKMVEVFERVDLYVGGGDLGIANLTGHPTVVFPTRISDGDRAQPKCSTITGRLHDEATLLAVARLVEQNVSVLGEFPSLDQDLADEAEKTK